MDGNPASLVDLSVMGAQVISASISNMYWLSGAQGNVLLRTTVFFTPFNDTIQRQGPLGLLDVSAQFGPKHQRWSIGVYTRNLTNEDYITGTSAAPPHAIGGRPGAPRQVGVQLAIGR